MGPKKKGKRGPSKKTHDVVSFEDDLNQRNQNGTGTPLQYASERLRSDKQFVINAISSNAYALQDVSEELKVDPDVVVAAVKQHNGIAWKFVPAERRRDKDFIVEIVTRCGCTLEHTHDKMRDNKNVVLAAVQADGTALRFASTQLKGDETVVTKAVTNNGNALEYASMAKRGDKEVVMAAITNDGFALQFASNKIKKDKDFVLSAVKVSACALKYASKPLRDNKEIVLVAVKQDGTLLKHASRELKQDEDIVLAAVRENKSALQYAPQMRRVKTIAMELTVLPPLSTFLDVMSIIPDEVDWVQIMQLHVRYRYKSKKYIAKDYKLLRDGITTIYKNGDCPSPVVLWNEILTPNHPSNALDNPLAVIDMAEYLYTLVDEASSLTSLSACAAAIRLYTHSPANSKNPSPITYCSGRFPYLVTSILIKMVQEKIEENATRPFFSVNKLKRLEDQFGIGMCSDYYHKCTNCGLSHAEPESSLERCSGCRRFWYCSNYDCCKKDCWPRHKEHECKGKWRTNAHYFRSYDEYRITKAFVQNSIKKGEPGISIRVDKNTLELILFCIDPDTNELFDGLTDRPIRIIDP